jgi:hypothetical protein
MRCSNAYGVTRPTYGWIRVRYQTLLCGMVLYVRTFVVLAIAVRTLAYVRNLHAAQAYVRAMRCNTCMGYVRLILDSDGACRDRAVCPEDTCACNLYAVPAVRTLHVP